MSDDIAEALSAEEHRQGMPVGDEAGHCDDCRQQAKQRDREARQAACRHGSVAEIKDPCGMTVVRACTDCGANLEGDE